MRTKILATMALITVISCAVAQQPDPVGNKGKRIEERASTESQTARLPGMLTLDGEAITIPARVEADKEFEIVVRTGGNGCASKGDAGVVLGESTADIFVYDLTSATRPGTMCTMIYKQFEHKTTLRFAEKGEKIIRVWARQSGEKSPLGEPVVVERKVIVN